MVTGGCIDSPILSVIILVIKKIGFPLWNLLITWLYDYRPNCTAQCPFTFSKTLSLPELHLFFWLNSSQQYINTGKSTRPIYWKKWKPSKGGLWWQEMEDTTAWARVPNLELIQYFAVHCQWLFTLLSFR